MPVGTNHLSIQTHIALHKLRTPLEQWAGWRDSDVIAQESLELAAGQLALCLATPEGEEPELLDNLIEEYMEIGSKEMFHVDLVLPESARAFLPAAQRIVALTQSAARRPL